MPSVSADEIGLSGAAMRRAGVQWPTVWTMVETCGLSVSQEYSSTSANVSNAYPVGCRGEDGSGFTSPRGQVRQFELLRANEGSPLPGAAEM